MEERSRTEGSHGKAPRTFEFYRGCWDSLNKWIVSKLRRRQVKLHQLLYNCVQGASVAPLGEFTWEIRAIDEEMKCRPIFLIGDSFVKDHHIKKSRTHFVPETAPSEEVNYSKLAIKFSKFLTKDMIFSGICDIIKKIGDFIDRFMEFEVDFAFGVLSSKERRVKFTFENSKLTNFLPESMTENLTAKALGYSMKVKPRSNQESCCEDWLTVDGLNRFYNSSNIPSSNKFELSYIPTQDEIPVTPIDSARPKTDGVILHIENKEELDSVLSKSNSIVMPPLSFKDLKGDIRNTAPISPGLYETIESLSIVPPELPARVQRTMKARVDVAEQAFRRCLHQVEEETQKLEYLEYLKQQNEANLSHKDKEKREKAKKQYDELRTYLQDQIEEFKGKKAEDKADRKNAKMNITLPSQLAELDAKSLSLKKQEILKELEKQIISKNENLKQTKYSKLAEEKQHLEQVARELDAEVYIQRAQHLKKQRELLDAWERDAHLHNLKKLQQLGTPSIKEYLSTSNLLSKFDTKDSCNTFRSAGVGFDSRKML